MVEPQRWVQRFGDEQHREEPLEAVHGVRLMKVGRANQTGQEKGNVEAEDAANSVQVEPHNGDGEILSYRAGVMEEEVEEAE